MTGHQIHCDGMFEVSVFRETQGFLPFGGKGDVGVGGLVKGLESEEPNQR